MSAVVLPFPAERANPRFITCELEGQMMNQQVRQARMLHETTKSVPLALWLAFLTTLPKEQLALMELQLSARSVREEPDVEAALAWVQFAGASREDRRQISTLLDRMGGQEVQS